MERAACGTFHTLTPYSVLDVARSSSLAIPHMDQLVGVLGPFVVAAAAVAAEAEAAPVDVVAARVPRLVVAV